MALRSLTFSTEVSRLWLIQRSTTFGHLCIIRNSLCKNFDNIPGALLMHILWLGLKTYDEKRRPRAQLENGIQALYALCFIAHQPGPPLGPPLGPPYGAKAVEPVMLGGAVGRRSNDVEWVAKQRKSWGRRRKKNGGKGWGGAGGGEGLGCVNPFRYVYILLSNLSCTRVSKQEYFVLDNDTVFPCNRYLFFPLSLKRWVSVRERKREGKNGLVEMHAQGVSVKLQLSFFRYFATWSLQQLEWNMPKHLTCFTPMYSPLWCRRHLRLIIHVTLSFIFSWRQHT